MPKFFDKLKDIGSSVADALPQPVKYQASEFVRGAGDMAARVLAAEERVGTELAHLPFRSDLGPKIQIAPRRVGPVNIEDVLGQILRPSNLIPVSESAQLLKARSFGPPLLRALAKEGAFAGGFSAAETARKGGDLGEAAKSGVLGFGIGAATPLGLHGVERGLSKLGGKAVEPAVVDTAESLVQKATAIKRMNAKYTPEELLAASNPRTIPAALESINHATLDLDRRIKMDMKRLQNPLGERPAGDLREKNVYGSDLLTLKDSTTGESHRYTERLLSADAGEMVDFPVITPGSHVVEKTLDKTKPAGKRITESRVNINEQEAEVLRELYRNNPNPTTADIRQELKKVEAPARVKRKGVEATPEGETAGEILGTKKQGIAKEAKPRTEADYKLIKQYIEKQAGTAKTQVRRPSVEDTPAVRDQLLKLSAINFGAQGQPGLTQVRGELEDTIAKLGTKAEKATAAGKELSPAVLDLQERIRILSGTVSDLENQRAKLLEIDPASVPKDPNEQKAWILNKAGELTGQPPVLPASQAQEALNLYRQTREDVITTRTDSIKKKLFQKSLLKDLAKGIQAGHTEGRVPGGGLETRASYLFKDYMDALLTQDKFGGKGIHIGNTAEESLSNFANLAYIEAHQATMGRKFVSIPGEKSASHQRIEAILGDLAGLLHQVDKPGGNGGRAFAIINGEKVYGEIKAVVPTGADPTKWTVDLLPTVTEGKFTPSRGIIPDLTVNDIHVEYKNDISTHPETGKVTGSNTIEQRRQYERDTLGNIQSEVQARVTLGTEKELKGAAVLDKLRQQQFGALSPLQETMRIDLTPEQLAENTIAKKDLLNKLLMPHIPGTPESPSQEALRAYTGFTALMESPVGRGKRGLETVEARQRLAQDWRERQYSYGVEGVLDPSQHDILDAQGDPVWLIKQMLGGEADFESVVREPSIQNALGGNIGRRVRSVARFVQAMAYPSDTVKGLNAQHEYNASASAMNVIGNITPINQALRKQALINYADVAGKSRASWRPDNLRASVGDTELEAVMASGFTPDPPKRSITTGARKLSPEDIASSDVTKGLEAIRARPTERAAALLDFVSRQPRFLAAYGKLLWRNLPQEYHDIASNLTAMNRTLHDGAAATGSASLSSSYSNRLMLNASVLRDMDQTILQKGNPLQVLAAADVIAERDGKTIWDVAVSGDDLTKAEPMAIWKSILMSRVTENVKSLGDPLGEKITTGVNGDISHTADRWSIRSLDKFKTRNTDGSIDLRGTKDLQDSLKELQNSLNRVTDLKGVQKLSQTVAEVALSADFNVFSVQGYAGFASKAVHELFYNKGNPIAAGAAMMKYVNGVRAISTDEGFAAFFKTHFHDIQLNVLNGQGVGHSAVIGGEALNKLPLEDLPILGVIPKTVREFNNLQFDRHMLFLKTIAIEDGMRKAQTLRQLGQVVSAPYMKLRGIKAVADELGSEAAYFNAQPEKVHQGVIRTVNNQFGGVNLNAQGMSQWSQAVQQVMSITPGFFHAQVGMFTNAITRPHSVEGWLAATGIAEEVAFAAAVATVFGLATGNFDKINFNDVKRSDWMAIPFKDSYIPLIPRVGIPRLAARITQEGAEAMHGGGLEGLDISPAIQSFAQARMSPILSATLGPLFFKQDFLGRSYRDRKDRAFDGLTSLMPIFAANIASDARENVAQSGWGALGSVAAQTPLQWLGKSVIPRPPIDKLNDIAQKWDASQIPVNPLTGQPSRQARRWNDLSTPEQEKLRDNPETQSAYNNYQYYQNRRMDSKEIQIEAQFKNAEKTTDELRTGDITWADGTYSMATAYDLLKAGRISGDSYREKLRYANGRISQAMGDMEIGLKSLGFDLNGKHEDRVKRIREIFKGSDDMAAQTQLAVWDTQRITPEQFQHETTVETPDGSQTFMETDWGEYQSARDDALAQYPDNIKLSALHIMDKWQDPGVDAYREASQQRSAIEDIPRYKGLSNENADKLDAMSKSFTDLSEQVRAKIGLPGSVAPLPKGLSTALRGYAVQKMSKDGLIKTKSDLKIATLALAMAEKPEIKNALLNPAQLSALIKHPNVLLFYPYLLHRVPVWLQGRLPANVQVWNRASGAQQRTGIGV